MKISLGVKNCLYPMLTTLIGANVNGKPNYITIAHVGIMTLQSISLGMGKSHFTNAGIKENGARWKSNDALFPFSASTPLPDSIL